MINPISHALIGLKDATKKLDDASKELTLSNTEDFQANLDRVIISTIEIENQFKSNALVIEKARELGALLDELI